MRIHSDILTESDLRASLPPNVYAYITPHGSRKRARAFEVTLYVTSKDDLHRRYGNSGGYGASSDVAATWDEWGIWMNRLYAIDPDALIGWYKSYPHFFDVTTRHRAYVRTYNKPTSVAYRTHTAPWLESSITQRLDYLRRELRAERISYSELAELQSLTEHIDPTDTELLEAAGVPEYAN